MSPAGGRALAGGRGICASTLDVLALTLPAPLRVAHPVQSAIVALVQVAVGDRILVIAFERARAARVVPPNAKLGGNHRVLSHGPQVGPAVGVGARGWAGAVSGHELLVRAGSRQLRQVVVDEQRWEVPRDVAPVPCMPCTTRFLRWKVERVRLSANSDYYF